ncbi:Putative glutamine amidotransferase-like protein C13C5.04 [Psilocybe cubensis]|uniref:Glutamine amidotransferase domain-containing protein n=2 Tax=Psilocybe cubensis TaxID=181762 RepID=A0A8H8CIZ3_PSICU|nr:Putative glutamine amidotransferase-like protein C13C5.04 [Psilocybe cubensis]KAH9475957.1 Putative glutamine amidotransferase-like protein C13C5.04 [Psilocybe cubensis]
MHPKIALLLCGNLTGKPYADHGGYQGIYSKFLQDTVPANPDSSTVPYSVDIYDVVHEMAYPQDDDQYDCIMLTGSAASAYENLEWITKLCDYISRIATSKPHIKIIGICFGHQIIARAMGGECVPNGGIWEVGPTRIQLTDIGKKIFGNVDTLTLQQMHRDHVPVVPPNFHLLASTETSPNQGSVLFYPEDTQPNSRIHILTVQGHPEFTEPVVTAIIAQRAPSGVINEQAVKDAETRRYDKTDGDVVGKAIWEVILGKI